MRIRLGQSGSVSRLDFRLGPLSFRHCGGMAGAPPGNIGQADLEGNHSYKFIYSRVFAADPDGRNLLILLVGAVRFELTTPCAQGRCATRLRYAPTFSAPTILSASSLDPTGPYPLNL